MRCDVGDHHLLICVCNQLTPTWGIRDLISPELKICKMMMIMMTDMACHPPVNDSIMRLFDICCVGIG